MNTEKIRELANGKSVAIFGKGISALCAKSLLDFLSIKSEFYSQNPKDECLIFDEENAKKHSLVVYSPAFRPDHEWLKLAKQANATLICEPDLAALAWQGKLIAISGTNGKTTSASFLTKALCLAGFDAVAAGNIGIPLSRFCVEKSGGKDSIAVCELSSFQLMNAKYIQPDAYIWTNFDQDHLDWHKSMEEYFLAKFNLVKFLRQKVLICGESVFKFAKEYGINMLGYAICVKREEDCPAPFDNNIQSENFSLIKALFAKMNLNSDILYKAASDFHLAKYRFATSAIINDITFINDSKGTNAHAAIAAIKALQNKSIIWIGGGKNKHCNLEELADCITKNCKESFLIGDSAKNLKNLLDERDAKATITNSLKEAVNLAYQKAVKGDYILFSPAFSSFGMFYNYVERGKCFDEEVLYLKN